MFRNLLPFGRRGGYTGGISLDREDNELREQFSRSVRRVRISRSLLSLAWSAGPVTGLGLYGGYYFAFGQSPSAQQLIYFITFTLLTGLLALFAKIIYDGTSGFARRQALVNSGEVIDGLGDLILAVRDLSVRGLEGESRSREAATQLLERVDLSATSVALACRELTGDRELARLLSEIDTYRRAGLMSRVMDLQAEHGVRFEQAIAELHKTAPPAAHILQQRYLGEVTRFRHGVPRIEYSIERVLAAIEQDNLLLITMQDVESMLTLAFELINGREIRILVFHYRGQWRLGSALDRMERRRSRYRIAQAAAGNRIRALASWLVEVDVMEYDEVPEGLSASVLIERVIRALDRLAARLDKQANRVEAGEADLNEQLRGGGETLASALRLYRIAYNDYLKIGRIHMDFLHAAESWGQLLEQVRTSPEELELAPRGRGLRIVEKVIDLGEEEHKEVCRHLARYFRKQHLGTSGKDGNGQKEADGDRVPGFDSARQLAVEVALALEPHIHLSLPEVQRGIDATLASYLGDLEPGMSAQEKRMLGESMAKDVREDRGRAAEQLALAVVRHYRLHLTDEACEFLHETYGARRSVLDILSHHDSREPVSQSLLTGRPAMVPVANRDWYRSLVRVRKLVGSERFVPPWKERL